MAFNYVCPLPAALTAPGTQNCPVDYGQIVKLAIRRITARTAVSPTFTSKADILNKAKWTAALAATDEKKIVITPLVQNFVIPPANQTTFGGNDNTTIDGLALLTGYESQSPTWEFRNIASNIIATLQSYTPYSLDGGLEVFLINGQGNIVYDGSVLDDPDDVDSVVPQGFQMFNFGVGPDSHAGFNAFKVNNGQFSFAQDWSKGALIAAVTLEGTPSPWNARQLI